MHSDHELSPFKVTHKRTQTSYYLCAKSASQAVEIVTLKLGDTDGPAPWVATSEVPPFPLKHGTLCDASGHTIHPVDY